MSRSRLLLFCACLLLFACSSEPSHWTGEELGIIRSLSLSSLDTVPASPSNRFADNPQAASLGEKIFFDTRFSRNGTLSCASCHQPERAFTDGLAKAQGILATARNTLGLLGVAHHTWFYWDGRKDSLWSQALVPFEAAAEMASNRVQVLRIIGRDPGLLRQYEDLFGKFPGTVYDPNIPQDAGPWGDSQARDNWYRLSVSTQREINRAFANVGKALAAYQRGIPMPVTRFDEFAGILLAGDEKGAHAMFDENEIAGLKLFLDQDRTHCLRCHNGPLLTNADFHNIGTGNFTGESLDFGRYLGVQAVVQDEFNCLGPYSDAKPEECRALRFLGSVHDDAQGAFKTPGLRYLDRTAPYFHDGRFTTLAQVLAHYLAKPSNGSELPELKLTDSEARQLLAFLQTLN